MRQVYLDNAEDNEIVKISFYSPSQGYVAFLDWVGFTSDSGHTFTKKYVTLNNVDYNNYSVNLTFGFSTNGVKAFDQNRVLLYGDYGLVPAILYSNDGGNTFKLVFHSQFSPSQLSGGVSDMIFPQDNNVGYASDPDRILKTTDGGLSWSVIRVDPGSFISNLEAPDNNNVFAFSTGYVTNKLEKTANGGTNWQAVTLPSLPEGKLTYSHFRTATNGWVSMYDNDSKLYFYKTTTGGNSWSLQNDVEATPFACGKMKFFDDNTGFALSGQNTVFKTSNGGAIWEPLPRDNNYSYLNYSHNDLFFWSVNQLWAGGGHGFLELSTNGGGTPLPKAYYKIDTAGLDASGNVSLVNFSRTGYSYKWFVNGALIGTTFNINYSHDIFHITDTIKLVVSNGIATDTSLKYQYFYPPVIVTSFTPTTAAGETLVTITGQNFSNVVSVSFGGVLAAGFSVVSNTTITATVGSGASGSVRVVTQTGHGSLAGFNFIPPPVITSFAPLSAAAGTTVTITGTGFTNVTQVKFGGVSASSFAVVSPTTITAVVPSGPSGSVSVTTAGGTGSMNGYSSLPTIISFSPVKGTQGTIMKIIGTSFPEVNSVTIGGVAVQSFIIPATDTIVAIVSAGATGLVNVAKPAGGSSMGSFTWFPAPTITSFTPASGQIGTTVTITGTNFNAVAANNVVYFGNVRATITGGSTTSLAVKVPAGASFEPISVLSNNLIAFSATPFLVTFPNGGSITAHSFLPTVLNTGGDAPSDITLGDLDGDGKTDLIVSKRGNYANESGAFLYRNTSTSSTISFDTPVNIVNLDYITAETGDLDGDGKLDIVIVSGASLVTLRNTSSPGSISFVQEAILPAGTSPTGIAINDIDGDGKADIAINEYSEATAYVYRNTSEPGAISFATRIGYPLLGGGNILLADFDGDHKPEMVIPSFANNLIAVYRNNSTKGNISFATPLNIPATATSIASGDMDGDGKTDLVSVYQNDSKVMIMRNIGSLGNIVFDAPVELTSTSSPTCVKLSDLDGDGKLDLGLSFIDDNFSVYKNNSTSGNFSFSPRIDYAPGLFNGYHQVVLGDINNDGKDDAVVIHEIDRSISVYINNVLPEPFINSFSPTIGEAGTSITITGNNFAGVTAVSFGGVNAASFTVNSPTSITAILGNGGSGDVSLTNSFGSGSLGTFVYGIGPSITTFSPAAGTVGSTVTITGTRFSPVVSENTVYFGSMKAVVTSATSTSITAIVPPGATYKPITVTVNNRTAYSFKLFNVTFPGASDSFSIASFAPRIDRTGGVPGGLADLDGDGKLDLLVMNGTTSMVAARNISTGGNLSFDNNVSFTTAAQPTGYTTGDLDGDGKLDVVAINYDYHSISVLKNNSSPGNISLTLDSNYLTGASATRPSDVKIFDLDHDGRPDVIVANYYSQTISIFRNAGGSGRISFDNRLDYTLDGYPTGVSIADMDGDGKPEMAVSVNGPEHVSVFRNISLPGRILFANKIDFATGSWPAGIATADLDGDGKIDVSIVNINSNTTSVFHNNSSSGNISFATKQDFFAGSGPAAIEVGDLDGDGKPDIAEPNIYNGTNVSVFKNISVGGNLSFKTGVNFPMPNDASRNFIGDLNGDGVPDIAVSIPGGTTSFLLNMAGTATVLKACQGSNTLITSNRSGTNYQWQENSGSGFVDISDNTNFSGTKTAQLNITNVNLAWHGYQFRCVVDSSPGSISALEVQASVTPSVFITSSARTICNGKTVTFTASPTNGGPSPSYQWKVNGFNDGSNSNSFSTSGLANNYVVSVIMTSNAGCVNPPTATSNSITMTVNPAVVPSVTISGNTVVTQGQSTTIAATINNGGSSPSLVWQDSTAAHSWQTIPGANSSNLNYSPAATGDKVKCILTNSDSCVNPASVTSPALIFTINTATGINVVPLSNYNIHAYPSPVHSTLIIDSLKLSDKWQSLQVISIDGRSTLLTKDISGQVTVQMDVQLLRNGIYLLLLRKRSGEVVCLKFEKL